MARPSLRRTPMLERLEAREVMSAGGPGPEAQYMLELINEARTNPAAAAERATSDLDGNTLATLAYFHEDAQQARREIAASPQRPALAWNDRLAAAAQAHSQDQANTGVQSHTGSDGSDLGTRLDRAGYLGRRSSAENAFGSAQSVDLAMKAFLLDWGVASRGHRHNLLQPDPADAPYREIGIGIAGSQRFGFGPKVVTQDFGRRDDSPAQLLGVAFDDRNGNRFYDPGEGSGNVAIEAVRLDDAGQPTGPKTTVTTWDAGGYQLPLNPGSYQVTARLGSRVVRVQRVHIGTENVKVDYNLSDPWEPPVSVEIPSVTLPIPATVQVPVPITETVPVPVPITETAPVPAPIQETAPVPAPIAETAPVPETPRIAETAPVPETPRIAETVLARATNVPSQAPRIKAAIPAQVKTGPRATAEVSVASPEKKAPDHVFGASWITSWTRWTASSARRSR